MEKILEKINKAALKFLAAENPEDTYKSIVNEAVKLVKAEDGVLFLKQQDELKIMYDSSADASPNIVPRKKGYVHQCFTKRQSFIIDVSDMEKIHPDIVEYGIKSTIFIPLYYKRISIGVLLVRSFTTKKLTEKEMEILKMYGSMASLAVNNISLLEETKNALQIRDMFISLASHELKTPLTAINGYIQLIQKKYANKDDKEYEWIANVAKESQRLTRLVNELLEINQIKTGQFQFNLVECDLKEILDHSITMFKLAHPGRKMNVTDSLSPGKINIIGDSTKLTQVFTNIFNNAVKFSSPNSTIKLNVARKNNSIVILVQDEGIGIKKEDLPKVFEGFYKGGHNVKEGMGLGLYLSKVVLEKHRGSISIDSQESKGTTVQLKLPLQKYG
jgi:signal transduction histidine kinase